MALWGATDSLTNGDSLQRTSSMNKAHLARARDYGVAKALASAGYKTASALFQEAQSLGLIKTALKPNIAGALGSVAGNLVLPNLGWVTGPVAAGLAAEEGQELETAGRSALGNLGSMVSWLRPLRFFNNEPGSLVHRVSNVFGQGVPAVTLPDTSIPDAPDLGL